MRIAILSAFLCAAAWGQCNCESQVACNTVCQPGSACYGSPSYSLANFLADTCPSFTFLNATEAHVPQPQILLTGQVIPCNGAYLSTAIGYFGPPCGSGEYSALMLAQGFKVQPVFMDPSAMAASVYCDSGHRNCLVPTDCAGGIHMALTNPPTAPPAGSGTRCNEFYRYAQMFQFMAANGITMRGGLPGTATAALNNCTIAPCPSTGYKTPGGLGGNPVITEAEFEQVILPLTLAEFDAWGAAITMYAPVQEPFGAMESIQAVPPFSISAIATILEHFGPAIKAISPTTKVGAAYTGPSYPVSSAVSPALNDFCYFADAAGVLNASLIPVGSPATPGNCTATTQSSTHTYLDYLELDVFNGTSCQGPSCGSPDHVYANELRDFQGSCTATYCTGFIANATAGGSTNNTVTLPVGVGQADPVRWASLSARPTEPDAYLGCLDYFWYASGFRQEWSDAFARWASVAGVDPTVGVALYFSPPLWNITYTQANDNCVTGSAMELAMSALEPNIQAVQWSRIAAQGPANIFQGYLTVSGELKVIPQ